MNTKHLLISYLLDVLTPHSVFYNIEGYDEVSLGIAKALTTGLVFHISKNLDIKEKLIPNIIATNTTDLELMLDYYVAGYPKPFIFLNKGCQLKSFIKSILNSMSPCKLFVKCMFNNSFYKGVDKLLVQDFKIFEILRNKPLQGHKSIKIYEYKKEKMYLYKGYDSGLETLKKIDVGLVQYFLMVR